MDRPADVIPVEATTRFTDAEARLYPMALADPDGYELATLLVGLIVNELRRTSRDMASVLERRAELIALVPQLADEAGLATGGVPAETVVDAGSALRIRELRGPG
jgi:hypothetical protein